MLRTVRRALVIRVQVYKHASSSRVVENKLWMSSQRTVDSVSRLPHGCSLTKLDSSAVP